MHLNFICLCLLSSGHKNCNWWIMNFHSKIVHICRQKHCVVCMLDVTCWGNVRCSPTVWAPIHCILNRKLCCYRWNTQHAMSFEILSTAAHLLDAEHSLCTAPWSGSLCRTTSAHSRTTSPLDRARKPGFSPDTSVFSALETFVIIALYKSTFTILAMMPCHL